MTQQEDVPRQVNFPLDLAGMNPRFRPARGYRGPGPDGYQAPRLLQSVTAQCQIIGLGPKKFAPLRGLRGPNFTTALLADRLRRGTRRGLIPRGGSQAGRRAFRLGGGDGSRGGACPRGRRRYRYRRPNRDGGLDRLHGGDRGRDRGRSLIRTGCHNRLIPVRSHGRRRDGRQGPKGSRGRRRGLDRSRLNGRGRRGNLAASIHRGGAY